MHRLQDLGHHEGVCLSSPRLCPDDARRSDKEVVGTLRGFDEYVNMVRLVTRDFSFAIGRRAQVLDDVTEYTVTVDGRQQNQLDQILLNGNNVCIMVPGGDAEAASGP